MLTALVTVILFLVLISIHEFGHFAVAKLVGIKVYEFAIGMGPAIVKWRGRETQYSVRIFPVGGYCRFEGEDEESEDKRAFCNQKLWKRFMVVVAGAVLNVVLGFAILFGLTFSLSDIPQPVISTVMEAGYADDAGIMPGDRIIKINGNRINFYPDLSDALAEITTDDKIELVIKRDGKKLKLMVQPSREVTQYYYEERGARVTTSLNDNIIIDELYQYSEGADISEYLGKTEIQERHIIGFNPTSEKANILNVAEYSFYYTGYVVKLVYSGFWDLFTGETGIENVSGPVGIVSAVNTMVNSGSEWVKNVLSLMALLTINLGVVNLLPLPALDGGRIFFMLIELIRRKPIPVEKEGMVHAIGLIIFLVFAVIISFKDIWMLFK